MQDKIAWLLWLLQPVSDGLFSGSWLYPNTSLYLKYIK